MDEDRLARVRANMRERGIGQLLVTEPLAIWWLCGYTTEPYERFFGLLVPAEGRCTIFLNRLFPAYEGADLAVVTYDDTDDAVALIARELDSSRPLAVDKELSARWLVPLMERGAAAGFALGSSAVDDARARKDARERELMRAASAVNDEAMAWLAAQARPGVTELEIAEGLLAEYRRLGAEDHSFTPVVSFGANAADPHHEPDGTRLAAGDMALFDVGCKRQRYCSDMTRTFFTAAPTDRQRAIYEAVQRANEAAEAIVRPGITFAQIDLTARRIIEDAGFGPQFNHRLGHQIGLTDHEPGDVSATHREPVEPGMCFSIEPGIYIPGEIGVRIEDLVIVTEDGCEILNSYPKGIQVIG